MALMMVGVFSIINNSTNTKDTVTLEDRNYLQVQTALSRFELDFSALTSPLFYSTPKTLGKDNPDGFNNDPYNGAQPFVASDNFFATTQTGELIPAVQMPDNQTLIFFTASHYRRVENAKQSRYSWVRYTLRDATGENAAGEKLEGKEWVRSSVVEDIYRGEFDWGKEKEFILLGSIKEFKWGFWDKERAKYVENIRELSQPNSVPRLVRISITWVAPDKTEINFNRTFRPLYPFFDTKAESDLLKARASQTQSGDGAAGGPFGAPPEDNPGAGGIDDDL